MAINSKQKGSAYERKLAQIFRDLGYTKCTTSRFSSKELDDSGIDLCNTGCWHIQAKAWERAPAYHDVLERMPKLKGMFNLIFHKKSRKGSVVVMSDKDFFKILELLIANNIIKP